MQANAKRSPPLHWRSEFSLTTRRLTPTDKEAPVSFEDRMEDKDWVGNAVELHATADDSVMAHLLAVATDHSTASRHDHCEPRRLRDQHNRSAICGY
jgi:hypothetical protein